MEVVRGGGGIGDDPVVLGAKLEEALEPGAGVFRTLAVVAVGKKKGDAGGERDDSVTGSVFGRLGRTAPTLSSVGEFSLAAAERGPTEASAFLVPALPG